MFKSTGIKEIPENYKVQGLKTWKQVTRRIFALSKIRKEQRNAENIFVEELGMDAVRELFNDIVRSRSFAGSTHGDYEAQWNYESTNEAIQGVTVNAVRGFPGRLSMTLLANNGINKIP